MVALHPNTEGDDGMWKKGSEVECLGVVYPGDDPAGIKWAEQPPDNAADARGPWVVKDVAADKVTLVHTDKSGKTCSLHISELTAYLS